MKRKKRIFIICIYALAVILLPFKIFRERTGFDQINTDVNTLLETINTGYPIVKTEMYSDMGLVLTNWGAIKVTSSGTRWIWNSDEMSYPQAVRREGDDIYILDSDSKVFKINFSEKIASHSELSVNEDSYISQGIVDRDGYSWILKSDKGSEKPSLMRINLKDIKDVKTAELSGSIYRMNAIGGDSKGNVWYFDKSAKDYSLVRATYDSASGKIITKTIKLTDKLPEYGIRFIIDKEDNIWQFDEESRIAKKFSVSGDNLSYVEQLRLDEYGEPILDSNGDLWIKVIRRAHKSVEFRKLKDGEFQTLYILPLTYEGYSIADENNLLQSYRNLNVNSSGVNFSHAYIVVNSTNQKAFRQFAKDRMTNELRQAKTMLDAAKSTLVVIDYNDAYKVISQLREKERLTLLPELMAIQTKVFTPDVVKVQNVIKGLKNDRNLKNYYDTVALINSEVNLTRNKEYLLAELDVWENKEIFTPEVIEATDAISRAWKIKSEDNILAAEAAAARVNNKENQKWLMDQIDEIKQSMKKAQQ